MSQSTTLTITSWNINSVRLRIAMVRHFLQQHQSDILCLQEIKCETHLFPYSDFKQIGYDYCYVSGQKSYNGVAIISKVPLSNILIDSVTDARDGARYISAQLPNGTQLKNYYIPAGGDIACEIENDKFKHKMDFVRTLIETANCHTQQIILGDFNIAPFEHDVWSHKQLLSVVSHTPQEVRALNDFKKAGGFCDIARHFHGEQEKLYSWWSYRADDWQASNKGRRLDHIWCSEPLISSISDFIIHTDYRGYDKPSDHVPISITYKI